MSGTGFVCELTPRCNLECAFCYNVWKGEGARIPAELPLDSWLKILDVALGLVDAKWLTFSGGEPLLYGGLEELVDRVHRRWPDLVLGLATNGILLEERRLDALSKAGIQHVELPLFTADEERYRSITGSTEAGRARKALVTAALAPVSVTVAVTVLPGATDDLESVLDFAYAIGADRIALNRFVPTGSGAAWQADNSLTDGELDDRLRRADAFAATKRRTLDVTLPVEDCLIPHELYPNLRFHPCTCGSVKWVIDPAGGLRTCEQSDEVLGSLLSASAGELFEGQMVETFLSNNFREDCRDCSAWARCGGGCRFACRSCTQHGL